MRVHSGSDLVTGSTKSAQASEAVLILRDFCKLLSFQ